MSYPTKLPKLFSPGFDPKVKPTVPVEIDWSNPLTHGLKNAFGFGGLYGFGYDIAANKQTQLTASAGSLIFQGGALYCNSSSSAKLALGEDWSGPSTTIIVANIKALASSWGALFTKEDAATSGNIQLAAYRFSSSDDIGGAVNNAATATFTSSSITSMLDERKVYALTNKTASNPTDMSWYENGNHIETYSGFATAQNTGSGSLYLANGASDVEFYCFYRFDRVLSSAEIKAISDNPYQLLKPKVDTLFITGTAAASQTITPAHLTSNSQVYAPTVQAQNLITPAHLASASQVYAPTVQAQQLITPAHLDSASQVYQPAVTTIQIITPDALDSNSAVYQPTLAFAGCGVLDINSTGDNLDINADGDSLITNDYQCNQATATESNTGGWASITAADRYYEEQERRRKLKEKQEQEKQPRQVIKLPAIKKKIAEVKGKIARKEQQLPTMSKRNQQISQDLLIKLYIELNVLQEQQRQQEELDIAFIMMMMAA